MATMAKESVSVAIPPHKERREISWSAFIWIGPALVLMLLFFIYPMIQTVVYSFQNKLSTAFVGFKNYKQIFTDPTMLLVLRNNLIWLVLGTILTVGLGLTVAVLVDRVKIERVIKSALFIPMALSLVAAGVIWRFVYEYAAPGQPQVGLLNAFLGLFHVPAQAWFENEAVNNFALIAIYVWIWTGFCMVILSAALKGIPDDVIEAAKIDGASRLTMFWRVMVPMISPTLGVVTTTMIINILKIFDVIYVNTGGNYNTSVVAMEFYNQYFQNQNYGLGSALAVILTIAILPVMYINIRRMRAQEGQR
jgi:alpha-glucoside transport system permease protein